VPLPFLRPKGGGEAETERVLAIEAETTEERRAGT